MNLQFGMFSYNISRMFSHWAEYINEFKGVVFTDRKLFNQNRLALTEAQIDNFWDECTLTQMESIFIIHHEYILNFIVSQLLQPYLTSRKIIYQAFVVSKIDQTNQQESLMYIYDCRIFRNNLYTKEQNDFISSFLLVYKENVDIRGSVYEVVDCKNLQPCKWILKVKQSGILRVYAYIKQTVRKVAQKNEKIVLTQDRYIYYMQQWLKFHYNYNIEMTVSHFFKGVLALLQNQILLHYVSRLTTQQIYERMYKRPIKIIEKPKNVEQFTFTEGLLQTETKWQTLKITAFRLKYRVEETEDKYECFRVEQPEQDTNSFEQQDVQDESITAAFDIQRKGNEDSQSSIF